MSCENLKSNLEYKYASVPTHLLLISSVYWYKSNQEQFSTFLLFYTYLSIHITTTDGKSDNDNKEEEMFYQWLFLKDKGAGVQVCLEDILSDLEFFSPIIDGVG